MDAGSHEPELQRDRYRYTKADYERMAGRNGAGPVITAPTPPRSRDSPQRGARRDGACSVACEFSGTVSRFAALAMTRGQRRIFLPAEDRSNVIQGWAMRDLRTMDGICLRSATCPVPASAPGRALVLDTRRAERMTKCGASLTAAHLFSAFWNAPIVGFASRTRSCTRRSASSISSHLRSRSSRGSSAMARRSAHVSGSRTSHRVDADGDRRGRAALRPSHALPDRSVA